MAAETLNKKCILLVEDETLIAMLFETALAGQGAEVFVAATVAEALALVEAHGDRIDAALLDGNLAGEPVFPVAECLSARGTPFVFLSGYDSHDFVSRFAGAAVLRKPVGIPALVEALQACTTSRR